MVIGQRNVHEQKRSTQQRKAAVAHQEVRQTSVCEFKICRFDIDIAIVDQTPSIEQALSTIQCPCPILLGVIRELRYSIKTHAI